MAQNIRDILQERFAVQMFKGKIKISFFMSGKTYQYYRNENGELHRTYAPAVRANSNYKIYYINGEYKIPG